MPTRRNTPPIYVMLAFYFVCLLMLPFVAVYVFGSKCRALLRRALVRQRDQGNGR
jgi:hypothetical protein